MMLGCKQLGVSFATLVLAVAPALAADNAQTFTGQVGDSMCGAKHEMEGSPADCTRSCIQHGSKYALIVGDKVYTLEADKKTQDELDKLAGTNAKITGAVSGNTIQVASVAPSK
jgi:hypothetical protein